MVDPKVQTATQLRNIEQSSGLRVADFSAAADKAGIVKHGQMVALFKSDFGLGHGNANLIAHMVRDLQEGGPAKPQDLLANQYSGAKAALRPIYDEVSAVALALSDEVELVVQKTGVSFRHGKQFALIKPASAKRVILSLNLDATPADARVNETTGMCSHAIDITDVSEVDDDVAGWIGDAYRAAG